MESNIYGDMCNKNVGNNKNNEKDEKKKRLLTLKTILDENIRIETISDKDTLKKVLIKIIGITSYTKIKHKDVTEIMEDVYREYNMK